MIAFVKGILEEVTSDGVIIEVNGMGMEVLTPSDLLNRMPKLGNEVKFYTYFHVREDAMLLFGFLNKEDLALFKLLITVNGVGPKAALAILSSLSSDTLTFAILSEDVKTISKAQGVGPKTAKKIVLELKEKVGAINEMRLLTVSGEDEVQNASAYFSESKNEAIEILTALGYSSAEAMKSVREASLTEEMSSEEIVKQALKLLG